MSRLFSVALTLLVAPLFMDGRMLEPNGSLHEQAWNRGEAFPASSEHITVAAEFVRQESLLKVSEGNHVTEYFFVSYHLVDPVDGLDSNTLSFVATDTYPDPRSRMKRRVRKWPFVSGQRTFVLTRDPICTFRAFYIIEAHFATRSPS